MTAEGQGKKAGTGRKRRPGKRAGLDVSQIIAAARTLPLEDLSMQSLADTLKVDRKALHYHVKDRQSLFELLAHDTFSRQLSQTRVSEALEWKEACRIYARDLTDSAAALAELIDYLWFGDVMNDLPLKPIETLFGLLHVAGFTDEESIRLMTALATLCLGHARDLAQAHKEEARTRTRLLKSALHAQPASVFPNLERISSRNVDTYSADQLTFSVDLIVEGAEKVRKGGPKNEPA